MKKIIITAFVLLLTVGTFAQDASTFGLKLSGFVKTDLFYDSHQTASIREGHLNLYPLNESLDAYGKDIYGKANFNILAVETRISGAISGPDVLGAKTSALVEGSFFGNIESDINGFRLRHAFVQLNWENTELLVGQSWHAMFITECYPGTVNFSTGAPFQPYSINPQIRFTQKVDKLKFIFTAMTQRDFSSVGPTGYNSSYIRNSVVPELNFTIKYHNINNNGNEFLLGAGADYLTLTPRIETIEGYATSESVNSLSFMAFMKVKASKITWQVEAILGQNLTHLTMLGGYAESEMINPITKDYEYNPIKTFSIWTDLHTNGQKFQTGIFAGYTKNNGFDETLAGNVYSRGSNIDYVYRISPRIIFNSGKMRFSGEIEYTTAAYGTTQEDLTVINSNEVGNLRFLVGVYYFF